MSAVVEVSVLMPVYNERATVERAIDAVLAADISPSLELLVIDDGSSDGTRGVLAGRSWPAEVPLLQHDRNRGKGEAIRTGLTRATGTYAAVMDADLEYEPRDLALLL